MAEKLINVSPTADDREQMGLFLRRAYRLRPAHFGKVFADLDKVKYVKAGPH